MENKMDATIRVILEGYFGEGSVEDVIDDLHRQIYKAGIREVADTFHDDVCNMADRFPTANELTDFINKWQAKLKEWGVKSG